MSSNPTVVVGTFTGTGGLISVPIGFVPDSVEIQKMDTPSKMWRAYPNRTLYSNGTAIRMLSTVGAVGAAGNNTAHDSTNVGSYVMAMGGPNDAGAVGQNKKKGFYAGAKLSVNGSKYIYTALRTTSDSIGGI